MNDPARKKMVFRTLQLRFSPSLNRPCRTAGKNHLAIGALGEKIARVHLRAAGRRILSCNFRAPRGGEVDIVARDGKTLTFVEVKTRTSREFGRPLDAVNNRKKQLMQRGAQEWLRLLGTRDLPWRFDVAEVILLEGEKPSIHIVEDVVC
ncbi:MAG: YraN family protein [Verrucomicrobiaceae bacterium]|nr:YraN family protein [Verrucomicrobiaceae bacterium]